MKRISFVLVITLLHLLLSLAFVMGSVAAGEGKMFCETVFAKFVFSPLYYPFRHTPDASWLIPANSLLWGIMAERLVWGRKTVLRRRAK